MNSRLLWTMQTSKKLALLKIRNLIISITSFMYVSSNLRNLSESEKRISILNLTIIDLETNVEEHRRLYVESKESNSAVEHRITILVSELEEARFTIEQLDRSRRSLESELHEAFEKIAELSSANSSLTAEKHQYSNELVSLETDYEDAKNEFKLTKERYNKCMIDLSRVTEEYKQEKEHSLSFEKTRKSYESQIRELNTRFEQVELNGSAHSKRHIQKLESKVSHQDIIFNIFVNTLKAC